MIAEVDFTACPKIGTRAYNGANGKKLAVEFDGAVWLLKFPPTPKSDRSELSYTNSCISEHLGSTIYRLLGVDAQETRLGTHVNGRTKIVCACRDFTIPNKRLLDFCSIKNTVIDSETCGTGTELDDILYTIEHQNFIDPLVVYERFWDMFVVDALLGNFDRHNGNWGFLVDDTTGEVALAPVYDCGSCLLPQADEKLMAKMLADESELDARIYTFPNSMVKINGKKINYVDFLKASTESLLKAALSRLLPRIQSLDFAALINDTPYLSDLQRDFLKTYLEARRAKVFSI